MNHASELTESELDAVYTHFCKTMTRIGEPQSPLFCLPEAQRLGRLLRPKGDGRQAHFYSIVARDTLDTDYAAHRQRFLAEQGYAYRIVDAEDVLSPPGP